jgi:uncharacterized repeat protein (TIGR01451 family)
MRHRRGVLGSIVVAAVAAVGIRAGTIEFAHAEGTFTMETSYSLVAPTPLTAGNVGTLDLTITNTGDATYPYDVVVQQYLPEGVKRAGTPVGITCEAYRGTHGGSVVYRDFCRGTLAGPIEPGASATFSLPVKLGNAGDFEPLGQTASGVPFTDPCCSGVFYPDIHTRILPIHVESAVVSNAPVVLPDVQVIGKLDSKATGFAAATPSDALFNFTVQNNGKADATDVVFTDVAPADLVPVSATSFGLPCAIVDTSISCPLGTVAPSAKVFINVTLRRAAVASGAVITNTVSATGTGVDAKPADNTVAISFQVK